MLLFNSQIKDPIRFRDLYELLTLAIDIGHSGNHRGELQLLASLFNKNEADLDAVIRDAGDCGLGDRLQTFFEAKPTALAVWLFQERLWPLLNPRLEEFVNAKPSSRLLRRFLERCQETASPVREQVEARIGVFFLRFLGNPELKILIGREASRIFQAWAEFDPGRGLAWLEHAVLESSDDDLRQFTGDADESGGWSGRRQIVWLCEHLACFAEYFGACERILFRLAQVETEIRIGNNSTNTWREMFLPVLANTEVPFPQRLQLLNERLRGATLETLELILPAFFGSIERYITRAVPPSIVGGRIVPDQWEPKTVRELEQCRIDTAKSLLGTIPGLSKRVRVRAVASVIDQLAKLLAYGIVEDLRDTLTPHLNDESLKRKLLLKLEEWLSWHERQNQDESRPEWVEAVRQWRDELVPATLAERIKDLTARDHWSVYRIARGRVSEGQPGDAFAELAKEILLRPVIVEEMASWFNSPEAVSAANLLFHLGFHDSEGQLLPTILRWSNVASATALVANYLKGIQQQTGTLPEVAVKAVGEVAIERPADALHIILLADTSRRGLLRLMEILPRLQSDQRGMLRQLSFDPWKELLGPSDREFLLQQFCDWGEAGDSNAIGIAMDIFTMWRHNAAGPISASLVPAILRLARLAATVGTSAYDHHWKEVVEELARFAPKETAELLADEITDVESGRYERGRYAQEILRAVAKDHPQTVMLAIGKWILDKRRSIVFRIFEFRGLFDAIGLQTVMPWVEKHGNAAAIGIARHLNGPRVENGVPVIPELADWLLPKYEHVPEVFQEFAMGRHSGQVRTGRARDREAKLEESLSPFEAIQKEWVKKWIKYERDSHRREIEFDDHIDEEWGRV